MPDPDDKVIYEFEGFTVDAVRRRLLRDGVCVPLTAKSLGYAPVPGTTPRIDCHEDRVDECCVAGHRRRRKQSHSADLCVATQLSGKGQMIIDSSSPCRGGGIVLLPRSIETRVSRRNGRQYFDRAVLRGYAMALAYVLLVLSPFAWSAL